jgi:hypothetical protein
MELTTWIWAGIALGSGLLMGELGGRIARRTVQGRTDGPTGRAAVRHEVAGLVGTFVFWLATAIGLLIAIEILDAGALGDLGERLREIVPRLGVAALLLIGGHAVSVALATMVGQSARKATGVRQRGLERSLQVAIMATAVVIALAGLGVQPSLIVVPLTAVIAAPALAFAMLSGLGGREVAGQLAAGRALRHQLREGRRLECGSVVGRIVALHPTSVEIECADGSRTHIPNRCMLSEPFSIRD